MGSIHSDFKDVCADIPRKCFAVILDHCAHVRVLVRVYELKLNKWHTFEITMTLDRSFHTMMASDGGLVCFICTEIKSFNCPPITVCNPLTRHVRQLPLNSLKVLPKMMQLLANPNAKSYKVIVVGNVETGHLLVESYHCEPRMWTSASSSPSDIFFGRSMGGARRSRWSPQTFKCSSISWMYDCAQGQVLELPVDGQNQYKHINGKTYALMEDHLFALNLQEYERRALGFKTSQVLYFTYHGFTHSWLKISVHLDIPNVIGWTIVLGCIVNQVLGRSPNPSTYSTHMQLKLRVPIGSMFRVILVWKPPLSFCKTCTLMVCCLWMSRLPWILMSALSWEIVIMYFI